MARVDKFVLLVYRVRAITVSKEGMPKCPCRKRYAVNLWLSIGHEVA
jgi:hypothetical protein